MTDNLEGLIDKKTMKIIRRKLQNYFPFIWVSKWRLTEVNEDVYTFEAEKNKSRYISYPIGRK